MIAHPLYPLLRLAAINLSILFLFCLFIPQPIALAGDPTNGTLSWIANGESDLAGYEIFFGDQDGVYNHPNSPISVGTITSYNFPAGMLIPGVHYYFALKARDFSGNLSSLSAQENGALPADTSPPTVDITAPTSGSNVFGNVSITASASDNVGVVGVKFLRNNVLIGAEDISAPYSIQWDTSNLPLGSYTLTAVAKDGSGNETTSDITSVNVIDPPTGTLTVTNLSVASGKTYEVKVDSLQNGERVYTDRTFTFTAIPGAITAATYLKTANDDKNSTGDTFLSFTVNQPVTLYVGHDQRITSKPNWLNDFTLTGDLLDSTDQPFDVYRKNFPAGTITLGGNHQSQSGFSMYTVAVTSDGGAGSDPPTVTLTSPSEGQQVLGVVTLAATVTGNAEISDVRFLVNDEQIEVEDSTEPYSVQWDTSNLTPGSFAIKAIASITGGNQTISPNESTSVIVNVTVVDPPTGALTITNLSVTSGNTYEVKVDGLQNGERVYTDRTYTFTTIPGALTGATYLKTANGDKNSTGNSFLSFTVNQPVTVYVGHDQRISSKPTWLSSYTLTGEVWNSTSQPFDVYRKDFPAGTITLGGNHQSQTGFSMYTVAVISDGEPGSDTTPPTVSLTAPNEGQEVLGVVTLSATAGDNIGVTSVRFLRNGVQVGAEDTTAPYSVQWDTNPLTPGPFTLTAIAKDGAGNETTSAIVNVTVMDPPSGTLTITNLSVASGNTYEVKVDGLQNGERVYTDRTYTFTAIPGALTGATYLKTANDDKNSIGDTFLNFTANQPVTVYVGHDQRITSKPSWLGSFTLTGEVLDSTAQPFDVYRKDFPAGTITLGGNHQSQTGFSMYTVAVISDEAPGGAFTITNLSVTSGNTYEVKVDSLQNGERVYTDRTYTFTTIPGVLTGATYLKTANGDKNSTGNSFLSFTVNQPVTVYVGHDQRITSKPTWLSSYTLTGEVWNSTSQPFDVYRKDFPAGTITLGGNHQSQTGFSMYTVAVTSP